MRRVVIIALAALLAGIAPSIVLAQADPLLTRRTDSQGVYLTDYGSLYGGLGVQYNPVSIANYALKLWDRYQQTDDQAYLDRFMCQAQWLYDNQHSDGTWKYTYSIPSYGLSAPWISCMAQGLGMQVLSHAYLINKEQSYIEKARLSIRPFSLSVKDGGVLCYFADGTPWYEEYASNNTTVHKVLNGFMFALQGMAKYLMDNEDAAARALLDEGLVSLDKKIAGYDAGYASYYDEAGNINVDYNLIHAEQLMYLYKLTGNERFRAYARRFDTYEPKAGLRALSIAPGQQDPGILVDGKRFNGSIWERENLAAQLQLDIGSSRSIDGVNFFYADRVNVASSMQLAVSVDGRRWYNITASASNQRGAYYPITTRAMYIRMYYFKQPQKARFIKVVLNQGPSKLIRLREVHPLYNQNEARFDQTSSSTRWNDVDVKSWYFPYISALEDSGLATGYTDGSFKPGNSITRAELAAWICRAYGLGTSVPGGHGSAFRDIESHWARSYIEAAGDAGIISGYPDGTFRPDNLVTRSETAKIIISARGITLNPAEQSHFSDVSAEHWAISYIEAAIEAGIINGYDGSTFKPDARITRAETAVILVRALGIPIS